MIKISKGLTNNPYLGNCEDTVFTVMIRDVLREHQYSEKFKKIKYVHGLLQYPEWNHRSNIFNYVSEENLESIRNGNTFFIFDASTEGFSPTKHFPFFDIIYHNCEKYKIDPSMIIYVSSNLFDEENIIKYCKEKNKKPINVFSFLSFEKVVRNLSITLEKEEDYCNKSFKDKYFSSLSRVIRPHRSMATFLLCHSELQDKALISHAKFDENINIQSWKQVHKLQDYTDKQVRRWMKKLPLIIDKTDFKKNWALTDDYYIIHRQTLFQIVNETIVDNYKNTSLFYSEKTFRPVVCFQPFVIYGQKGCNQYLKKIGYKTYNEWFDLSFDDEEDNNLRYKKLLSSIKETCKYLDSLTRENQIEWRFKNKELLQHNFNVMTKSEWSTNKLIQFLEKLDAQINNKTT